MSAQNYLAQPRIEDEREDFRGELDGLEQKIERLMTRMRIAVIFGSDKTAPGSVLYQTCNTRSWKSYEAVARDIARSLERLGFRHVQLMPDDMQLGDRLRRGGIHMAWLNTGGIQGYNPAAHASSMLEMLGVPYVGHDPLAATTLDNKHAFAGIQLEATSKHHRTVLALGEQCAAADRSRGFVSHNDSSNRRRNQNVYLFTGELSG